ncbi:MAG: heparan-alpha-glucosaminide N-acetyltransferase domain-containing protein, partial [Chloroflexi bacterium]|nr:heparan-alpha-glucosaminide N-acetyltransferase domain-containing protein [Chloroflexota bacterium]
LPWWVGLGRVPLAQPSADYTPMLPLFGMLLLGLAAGRTLYPDGRTRKYSLPDLARYPFLRALAAL